MSQYFHGPQDMNVNKDMIAILTRYMRDEANKRGYSPQAKTMLEQQFQIAVNAIVNEFLRTHPEGHGSYNELTPLVDRWINSIDPTIRQATMHQYGYQPQQPGYPYGGQPAQPGYGSPYGAPAPSYTYDAYGNPMPVQHMYQPQIHGYDEYGRPIYAPAQYGAPQYRAPQPAPQPVVPLPPGYTRDQWGNPVSTFHQPLGSPSHGPRTPSVRDTGVIPMDANAGCMSLAEKYRQEVLRGGLRPEHIAAPQGPANPNVSNQAPVPGFNQTYTGGYAPQPQYEQPTFHNNDGNVQQSAPQAGAPERNVTTIHPNTSEGAEHSSFKSRKAFPWKTATLSTIEDHYGDTPAALYSQQCPTGESTWERWDRERTEFLKRYQAEPLQDLYDTQYVIVCHEGNVPEELRVDPAEASTDASQTKVFEDPMKRAKVSLNTTELSDQTWQTGSGVLGVPCRDGSAAIAQLVGIFPEIKEEQDVYIRLDYPRVVTYTAKQPIQKDSRKAIDRFFTCVHRTRGELRSGTVTAGKAVTRIIGELQDCVFPLELRQLVSLLFIHEVEKRLRFAYVDRFSMEDRVTITDLSHLVSFIEELEQFEAQPKHMRNISQHLFPRLASYGDGALRVTVEVLLGALDAFSMKSGDKFIANHVYDMENEKEAAIIKEHSAPRFIAADPASAPEAGTADGETNKAEEFIADYSHNLVFVMRDSVILSTVDHSPVKSEHMGTAYPPDLSLHRAHTFANALLMNGFPMFGKYPRTVVCEYCVLDKDWFSAGSYLLGTAIDGYMAYLKQ